MENEKLMAYVVKMSHLLGECKNFLQNGHVQYSHPNGLISRLINTMEDLEKDLMK